MKFDKEKIKRRYRSWIQEIKDEYLINSIDEDEKIKDFNEKKKSNLIFKF